MLTPHQLDIVEAVEDGCNVFITGPGGVGKSYVISKLKEKYDDKCVVTAMTGAAAVLIGGRTLHSSLGIGLARETSDVLAHKVNKQVWINLQLLIVDEISMLSAELLDKIEHIARMVRKNDRPFGGVQLLLSGDFLQLPTINGEFCFKARCWDKLNLKPFVLTEIKRQVDVTFQRVLNSARNGTVTDSELAYLLSGGESALENEKNGIIPTRIMCKHMAVDVVNDREFAKLPSEYTYTYHMEIELKKINKSAKIKPELYCSAPKSITLAIGAQVMLLTNKDQAAHLVNGSRGVVTAFCEKEGVPVVRFTNGIETLVDFYRWDISEGNKVYGYIHALPLKLAWAITCHKSQGVSIDSARIDLEGVFEYGQSYVAISRVRSHDALILTNVTTSKFKAHPDALKFYEELAETQRAQQSPE